MRVLVAGGAGYIGSVTSETLLDTGHEVTVFDNLERGHRAAIDPRATFIHGDLRRYEDIAAAIRAARPDAVMHFAAFALVAESMQQPELYFRNNVLGGIHLIEAMLVNDVRRIVFSSTCATYGQPDRIPITEDEKQTPTNPYGESKLMFEQTLNWYRRIHGFKATFLRYFNASGATARFGEDHTPETHLIPIVLQTALGKRDHVMICGADYDTPDGSCIRDYIHIADLADAHLRALTTDEDGPFNLGNGTGYSVQEVVAAARRVTGHPIPAEIGPRRPGDPARLVAGSERARSILGWMPRFPELEAIIECAWKWHRQFPDGYPHAS